VSIVSLRPRSISSRIAPRIQWNIATLHDPAEELDVLGRDMRGLPRRVDLQVAGPRRVRAGGELAEQQFELDWGAPRRLPEVRGRPGPAPERGSAGQRGAEHPGHESGVGRLLRLQEGVAVA
jgi:hypothetical protein